MTQLHKYPKAPASFIFIVLSSVIFSDGSMFGGFLLPGDHTVAWIIIDANQEMWSFFKRFSLPE